MNAVFNITPLRSSQHSRDPPPTITSPSDANSDLAPGKGTRKPYDIQFRYSFALRTLIFALLETGFIVLAAFATAKPIPLHLTSDITIAEAKGAITIITIIWHSLAVYLVKDVTLYVFSAEWMEQFRRSGRMISGETDIVSRLMSGLVNQTRHFVSLKASFPYCLAFLASLLFMALNGLGPSTITVNAISIRYPLSIQIANLTMTTSPTWSFGPSIQLLANRANFIIRLENFEKVDYGFQGEDSVLIPWPTSDLLKANGTITYQSDVIKYDFTCSWKQPTMALKLMNQWNVDGMRWTVHDDPLAETNPNAPSGEDVDAIIRPMRQDPVSVDDPHLPLIPFIFFGGNTTVDSLSSVLFLTLDGLPTVLLPENSEGLENKRPMVVVALICDPQLQVVPATVTLSRGSLRANLNTGSPVIGNVLPEAAKTVFSQSLLEAVGSLDPTDEWSYVNAISRLLFLGPSPSGYGTVPVSLDQINKNMNKIMLSASKAFLDGYKTTDQSNLTSREATDFEMILTDATAEADRLALVGSRPFLVALIVVVGIICLLLVVVTVVVRVDKLHAFDLESIAKIAKKVHIQ